VPSGAIAIDRATVTVCASSSWASSAELRTPQFNGVGWHRGAGGGIWVSLFNSAVLSASVGSSKEQAQFVLATGFLF